MSKEATTTINAFDYSNEKLEALSIARLLGLTSGLGMIDALADGGAQLITSFGKDAAQELFPKGLLFELSDDEINRADAIIAQVLGDFDGYRAQAKKIEQEVAYTSRNMRFHRKGMIQERKEDVEQLLS